jgi:CPA1 family monovalent cation:H+ antiporter
VLTWGGLRGALSLALALSLPATFGADRDLLSIMAFAVVLFTLLGQGMTMGPLLRWLRIIARPAQQLAYEMHHARLASLRMAELHMERQFRDGLLSAHTWNALKAEIEERADALSTAVQELLQAEPALAAAELSTAHRALLYAQRSALMNLRHSGVISDETLEKFSAEIDAQLTGNSSGPEASSA